jgi:hypothetical protein
MPTGFFRFGSNSTAIAIAAAQQATNMHLDDRIPKRKRALFASNADAIKRSPRPKSRSPYPIISMDTDDADHFVVRIAYGRSEVVEFGVGTDWELASREFRRICDRVRVRQ